MSEVDYAILEQNGQISVLRKRRYQPPDAETLGVKVEERGITHLLVSDGTPVKRQLRALPNAASLLGDALGRTGCTPRELFLVLADDKGNLRAVRKEGRKKKTDRRKKP